MTLPIFPSYLLSILNVVIEHRDRGSNKKFSKKGFHHLIELKSVTMLWFKMIAQIRIGLPLSIELQEKGKFSGSKANLL